MVEAYHAFAAVYDRLMEEIPYREWCQYVTGLLSGYGVKGGLLLELGCGTGTLTELFAQRGFDMIGIDGSEEMLTEAMEKRIVSGHDILYLHQDMREFELYGTVAGVVSLCDTMNYLTEWDDLVTVLRLVNNYLDPGGIFIFDMKTEHCFAEKMGERIFAETDEDVSYVWQNDYDRGTGRNQYFLTLFFREKGNLYRRFDELHEQQAYSLSEIRQAAEEAGMEFLAAYDGNGREVAGCRPETDAPVCAEAWTERIYYVLREKGKAGRSDE